MSTDSSAAPDPAPEPTPSTSREVRSGETVPLGVAVVLPVPPPVCRTLATCERGENLVVQVGNGLFQAVPAGIQVVHVQDVRGWKACGQGSGEVRLARAAGPVNSDDFRGAATRFGLGDGQERSGDCLARRCDVHVWTVDNQGPWLGPLGRLTW